LPARIKDGMTRALARWTVASVREQIVESSERLVALEAENLELRAAHSALQLEANQRAILVPLAPHAAFLRRFRPPSLHLNGCGDFQLTAREHWLEFHGYPELETFSMNIDGLFSYVAHYGGLTECVLEEPCCIYHLEHEKGSGWTPEGEQALRRRIDERGIPWLDATIVSTWASYMQWLGRPMLFNGSDWGFASYAFEETTIDASDRSLA
jgi:hypothetical protein